MFVQEIQMAFVRTCFCGKSTTGFKKDIGPNFFGDECCDEAGYDHLGNLKREPVMSMEGASEPIELPKIQFPGPEVRLGTGKLRDLRLDQLVNVAESRGLQWQGLTKKQLIEVIFKAQA